VVIIQTLLPVLKENKRYILYEIFTKEIMQHNKLIESELRNFIGDLGLAKAGLSFIKTKNNRGILQVSHKSLDEVKTGLALIDSVPVRTVLVSGTLKTLLDRL